jgi:hypothetical protein
MQYFDKKTPSQPNARIFECYAFHHQMEVKTEHPSARLFFTKALPVAQA